MKKMSLPTAIALAVVAVALCLYMVFRFALSSDDLGQTVGQNDMPDYEAQIKAIEDNPNIPAQGKAIAIGTIRSRMPKNIQVPNRRTDK